ncbi:MAG: sulfur carrier protein ThiS [Puniceicoccales bacterium]|nr:sulfur carrier protein ThiS [Puniceicoccales bacterium]
MIILVNGESREVAPPITLAQFMDGLAMRSFDGVAAALNDCVVPRSAWGGRPLADGDRLLLIQAAQGG